MAGSGVVIFTGPGGMTEAMHDVADRVCSVASTAVSYPDLGSWTEAEALSYVSGFPDSCDALVVVGFGEGTIAATAVASDQRVGGVVLVNGAGHLAKSGAGWPDDIWLDLIVFETEAPFFGDRVEAEALARRTPRAELSRLPAHPDGLTSVAIQSAIVDAITPLVSKSWITFECDVDSPGRPKGWGRSTVTRDTRDAFNIEMSCEHGQLHLTVDGSKQGPESRIAFRSECPTLEFDLRTLHRSHASALAHIQLLLIVTFNALGPNPSRYRVPKFLDALRAAWDREQNRT